MRRERSPRCAVEGLKTDSHWSWTAAAVHGTCIQYSSTTSQNHMWEPLRLWILWALGSGVSTPHHGQSNYATHFTAFQIRRALLIGSHFQRVAWQKAEEVANQIGTDRDANLGGSATIDIRQTQDKRREEILSRRDPWMGWDGMVGTRRDEMR